MAKKDGKQRPVTYLDKEKQIIQALKKANGAPMFDSADEGYDFIDEQLQKFPNYVNTVVAYERTMPILFARYEGQDLRDHITQIDGRRRSAHEAAISSVNIMNRLCDKMGLPKFADIDTSDRHKVADFCGQYVIETYNGGIGGTMDEAVLAHGVTEYDKGKITERIRQAEALADGIEESSPDQAEKQ